MRLKLPPLTPPVKAEPDLLNLAIQSESSAIDQNETQTIEPPPSSPTPPSSPPPPSTATIKSLDDIMQQLLESSGSAKDDIYFLITPAALRPGDSHNFNLHLIGRGPHQFGHSLGRTSISRAELLQLGKSRALQEHFVVIGTGGGVGLAGDTAHSMTPTSEFLVTLSHNVNRKHRTSEEPTKNVATNSREDFLQQITALELYDNVRQLSARENKQEMPPSAAQPVTKTQLYTFMERMGRTKKPKIEDTMEFFRLAWLYKMQLCARPHFAPPRLGARKWTPLYFIVECYLRYGVHVGSIKLSVVQLHGGLVRQPGLLPNLEIIDDVFELTPMPRFVACCMRFICSCLGLEYFYDALGQFTFDVFKRFARGETKSA